MLPVLRKESTNMCYGAESSVLLSVSANLTQAGIMWKGKPHLKMCPSDWPVGKTVRHFFFY